MANRMERQPVAGDDMSRGAGGRAAHRRNPSPRTSHGFPSSGFPIGTSPLSSPAGFDCNPGQPLDAGYPWIAGAGKSTPNPVPTMHLTLEFGGGLELLLENSVKVHKVEVQPKDGDAKVTMKGLLSWVKSNLIKERPEMFVKGDSVRPGVLVLINDCDWELCGGLDAELEEKDVVVFISTLHGG
ncbi:hypothetical protein EJB05_12795, partial [Eragrostis curvula]